MTRILDPFRHGSVFRPKNEVCAFAFADAKARVDHGLLKARSAPMLGRGLIGRARAPIFFAS